jgi:hypothetical protein
MVEVKKEQETREGEEKIIQVSLDDWRYIWKTKIYLENKLKDKSREM